MHKPTLASIIGSIFVRLPPWFIAPFLILTFLWTLYLCKRLSVILNVKLTFQSLQDIPVLSALDDVLFAMVMIFIYGVGMLVVYNLSVLINWALVRYVLQPLQLPAAQPLVPEQAEASERFKDIKKIGIVLAGGGAKGAFQAGAMKAIYQFLAENNALDKVKVISGTSIGSWNALFWLAGLMLPKDGWEERSEHEKWWRSISLKALVAPSWYVPALRNAFFVTNPWQLQFDGIFKQPEVQKQILESKINFYFTRSHVRSGKLECTTNNAGAVHIPRVSYKVLHAARGADKFMEGVKIGVFASMDLPPLFPYVEMDDNFFEDGGVIDNLPIIFAAMEECDLIFVLPLNSDFYAEPDHRSIISRFFRVMDVRQGALERNSLKILYLFNELAVLRNHLKDSGIALPEAGTSQISKSLNRALNRTHQPLRLFAVCPLRSFVQTTIDTQELWKSRQAGIAFNTMYMTTKELLATKFDELLEHEKIQVALVSREGEYTFDDNF